MKKYFYILLTMLIILFIPINVHAEPQTEIIFVGDSRTIGMDKVVKFSSNDNIHTVAKVGKGYQWLISEGITQIESIESDTTKNYVEVYLLGINDLKNVDKYTTWYQERAKEHNIILVSVNPVENYGKISNYTISNFNAELIDTEIAYIDTNTLMQDIPFKKTVDGLHYNKEAYVYLYGIISESIVEYM